MNSCRSLIRASVRCHGRPGFESLLELWNLSSGYVTRCQAIVRELKQTRRRRKREGHLKMWLSVSAIIFHLFKLIMLEKSVLTVLELNCNQRLGHKTKLNICHHMLTSSAQLQNRSFHVVERTRTSSKCQKMKMHVQCVQKYCFSLSNMQICGVFVAVVVVVA